MRVRRGALILVVAMLAACSGSEGTTTKVRSAPAGDCGDGLTLVWSTPGRYEEESDIAGLTMSGQVRRLTRDGESFGPAVAPDGRHVAFSGLGDRGEVSDSFGPSGLALFVMAADGSGRQRITATGEDRTPDWSPDGKIIAFASSGNAELGDTRPSRVHVVAPDGSGEQELVAHDGPEDDTEPAWSADGSQLAFVRTASRFDGPWQLVVVDADGTGEHVVLTSPDNIATPTWSPDGRRIAVSVTPQDPAVGTGHLALVDMAAGSAQSGDGSVFGSAWAPNGRLYGFAKPSAVADFSGNWRVTEIELEGGKPATGRAVSAIEPVFYLYSDFRVDVADCTGRNWPALTSKADMPESLTVSNPRTGTRDRVLTRQAALDLVRTSYETPPDLQGAQTKLVVAADASGAGAGPAASAAAGPATTEPQPPNGFPPVSLGVSPDALVWLEAFGGGLTVIDARTGAVLRAGGGPDIQLPDVADLAP